MYQKHIKDFKDAIPLDAYTKYTTWRPIKFNASCPYPSIIIEAENDCSCHADDGV
jgi:hypothetical protein